MAKGFFMSSIFRHSISSEAHGFANKVNWSFVNSRYIRKQSHGTIGINLYKLFQYNVIFPSAEGSTGLDFWSFCQGNKGPLWWNTPGYAVLVEKVGLFLEKVGLIWKKPYFFSDCQVLVVWRKSRAFSEKALLFPKLSGFLFIRGLGYTQYVLKKPGMFQYINGDIFMLQPVWIDIVFAASLVVCLCDQLFVMYWPGRRYRQGRGMPVRDSCRAPHRAPRPVRQGKKSGPAEGLQGRSVRGRVGQWQDGPVQEVLAVV
jgi:hypothetical protein